MSMNPNDFPKLDFDEAGRWVPQNPEIEIDPIDLDFGTRLQKEGVLYTPRHSIFAREDPLRGPLRTWRNHRVDQTFQTPDGVIAVKARPLDLDGAPTSNTRQVNPLIPKEKIDAGQQPGAAPAPAKPEAVPASKAVGHTLERADKVRLISVGSVKGQDRINEVGKSVLGGIVAIDLFADLNPAEAQEARETLLKEQSNISDRPADFMPDTQTTPIEGVIDPHEARRAAEEMLQRSRRKDESTAPASQQEFYAPPQQEQQAPVVQDTSEQTSPPEQPTYDTGTPPESEPTPQPQSEPMQQAPVSPPESTRQEVPQSPPVTTELPEREPDTTTGTASGGIPTQPEQPASQAKEHTSTPERQESTPHVSNPESTVEGEPVLEAEVLPRHGGPVEQAPSTASQTGETIVDAEIIEESTPQTAQQSTTSHQETAAVDETVSQPTAHADASTANANASSANTSGGNAEYGQDAGDTRYDTTSTEGGAASTSSESSDAVDDDNDTAEETVDPDGVNTGPAVKVASTTSTLNQPQQPKAPEPTVANPEHSETAEGGDMSSEGDDGRPEFYIPRSQSHRVQRRHVAATGAKRPRAYRTNVIKTTAKIIGGTILGTGLVAGKVAAAPVQVARTRVKDVTRVGLFKYEAKVRLPGQNTARTVTVRSLGRVMARVRFQLHDLG